LPCGITLDHLPQYELTEDICLNALLGEEHAAAQYEANATPSQKAWSHFRRGSNYLELATHPDTPSGDAEGYLEDGLRHLNACINDERGSNFRKIDAHCVLAQISLFQDLGANGDPTPAALQASNLNLARVADQLPDLISDHGELPLTQTRIAIPLLLGREDVAVFPALYREMRGRNAHAEEDQRESHAMYVLGADNKLPINFATGIKSSHYDGLNLSSQRLFSHAFGIYAPDAANDLVRMSSNVLDWLSQEVQGNAIPPSGERILDEISGELFVAVQEFTADQSA